MQLLLPIVVMTLLSVTDSLVVVQPSLYPADVVPHAVASFGPQVLGDPMYPGSFPAVTATLVGTGPSTKTYPAGKPLVACEVTEIPDKLPPTWFLMAMRGDCDFATKAEVAQEAGATGIIVYNNVDGPELVVMHEGDYGNDILIPSIFISHEMGQDLLQFAQTDTVILTINATGCEMNCGPWENQWQITVLWFLFIAFLAMWLVVLVCFSTALCKRWCHRTARQRAVGRLRRRKYKKIAAVQSAPTTSAGDTKENDDDETVATENTSLAPTSPSEETALRQQTVDPESRFEQDSCVICLCEFENGDQLMVLPCDHEFHAECVSPWLLKKSSKCPICKTSCMPKPQDENNARTPLLEDGENDETYDPEMGDDDEEEEEQQEEDSDDEDSDDERTDVWNTRIFGMHPGALVLTGACCTGVGIAVAIMIFLMNN